MTIIEIHEFSTGITVEGTYDNWISRGFTGQYMNLTLPSVPQAVENAIYNKEFSMAEGASREEAAIIGREVQGNGEEWSVLAIVTRERDDKGRKPSLYRYFLCKGRENLADMVSWWTKSGRRVFNPFDFDNRPHSYDADRQHKRQIKDVPEQFQDLLGQESPIIIPSERKCSPLILNNIASQTLEGQNGQLISWAYNVEALVKPNLFQVIYPASSEAEQRLRREIATLPKLKETVPEEQSIKTAIHNLISSGKTKQEHIQTIESNLDKLNENYWRQIFSQEGSQEAQNSYHERDAKLLTLQAMILPTTLLNFLNWVQKQKQAKVDPEISQGFQNFKQEILFYVVNGSPKLLERVKQGVNLVITNLVDQHDFFDATVELLSDESGLWANVYKNITAPDLKSDLETKGRSPNTNLENLNPKILNDKHWKNIRNDLEVIWRKRDFEPFRKYLPLAELFRSLKSTSLAAFFYNFAKGSVPKKLFLKSVPSGEDMRFGVRLRREVKGLERFWNWITQGREMSLLTLLLWLLLTLIGAGLLGGWIGYSIGQGRQEPPDPDPDPIIVTAQKEFNTTKKSINEIVNEFKKNHKVEPDDTYKVIRKVLVLGEKIPDKDIEKDMKKHQDHWIKAIINYEKDDNKVNLKDSEVDGIIKKKEKTYNILRCDIAKGKNITLDTLEPKPEDCKAVPQINPPGDEKVKKAIEEFNKPEKTKYSLEELAKEITKLEKDYDLPTVQDNIVLFLKVDGQSSYNTMKDNEQAWVEAILKYQQSKKLSEPDGIINYNKETYNVLKCEVADNLNVKLPGDRPEICK